MDAYVTPTDDTDYNCHNIKAIEQSYGIYITPHHVTSY